MSANIIMVPAHSTQNSKKKRKRRRKYNMNTAQHTLDKKKSLGQSESLTNDWPEPERESSLSEETAYYLESRPSHSDHVAAQ